MRAEELTSEPVDLSWWAEDEQFSADDCGGRKLAGR